MVSLSPPGPTFAASRVVNNKKLLQFTEHFPMSRPLSLPPNNLVVSEVGVVGATPPNFFQMTKWRLRERKGSSKFTL